MNEKMSGAFIASLRKERGLTQKQLAEKLSVTDKAVSKWETGRGIPDIDSLMALSKCFGVTVNELLVGERLHSAKKEKEAQKNIAAELIDAKQRRRRLRLVTVVAAVLTVMFIFTQIFGMRNSFSNVISHLQADSVCHISANYTSLDICGVSYQRMYRLADEDCEVYWEEDRLLCDRPMVGDTLSYQDKIYSVKYCDNYDFVCLKQDSIYENAIYCKSDKIDKYREYSDGGKKVYYIREYVDYNKWHDTELSDSFSQAVDNLTEDDFYINWHPAGDLLLDVYSRFESSPLLRFYGYLEEENGRFFITFSEGDVEHPKDITYRLNESVSEQLSAIIPTE